MNRIAWLCVIILCVISQANADTSYPVSLELNPSTSHNLEISAKDGLDVLTITGADPYVEFTKLNLAAGKHDVIEVKYRSTSAYTAQVYWYTKEDPGYSQAKCINFKLAATGVPGTAAVEEGTYELPIGRLSGAWSGTVAMLRFDPSVDEDKGEVELVSARIVSRPTQTLPKPAPAAAGEYVAEVLTGIDPTSGARFIEDGQFKIKTRGAGLTLTKLNQDGEEAPLMDMDVEMDRAARTAPFSTDKFASDNLFCRFQDRWREQVMSLFYRSPNGTSALDQINARVDVAMEAGRAPNLRFSGPARLALKPTSEVTEIADSTGKRLWPRSDGSPSTNWSVPWIVLRLSDGSKVYASLPETTVKNPSEKESTKQKQGPMTVSPREVKLALPNDCEVALSTIKPISEELTNLNWPARRFAIMDKKRITLRPGVTIVDADVTDMASGDKFWNVPVAFSMVVSSDYVEVNLPVAVMEARVVLPEGVKVLSVTNAILNEDTPHKVDKEGVILFQVMGRTVKIKCDRLLDYRVMFNAPRPIDGGHFAEEFTNYYYPQWMLLWDGWVDENGKTKLTALDWLDSQMQAKPLPVFVGLHYGNHGPLGSYDTFHKLHPGVMQVDNHGNEHKGYEGGFGTPPWMCLVHPELRSEITSDLDPMFETMKSRPWYSRVFGFGSTSEPWIVQDAKDPETVFCYNPEHIKWFRSFEQKKWNSDLKAFNGTFGTAFKTWDEVEPPRRVEKSAYYNEWLLSKTEAIVDSESFYRNEIFKNAPDRPNFAHSAILVIYNQIKNSDTPDIMHVGKDTNPGMFKEGGSLYANDPAAAAYVADSIRAYDTDVACFPECYAPSYSEMYSYLIGESGLFKQSFNMMIPGPSWDSGVKVGNAWPVFSEIMRFLCMDMGEVAQPQIGLVFDVISDNESTLRTVHNSLFERNVDRSIVTTRMIENGYLTKHPLKMLILPDVWMLSDKAITEIAKAAGAGMKVAIAGEFAKSNYYYQESKSFAEARKAILSQATTIESPRAFAGSLEPQVGLGKQEGIIAYKKSRGITLYNRWADQEVVLEVPKEMQAKRVAVISDTGQILQIRQTGDKMALPMPGMRACAVVQCN